MLNISGIINLSLLINMLKGKYKLVPSSQVRWSWITVHLMTWLLVDVQLMQLHVDQVKNVYVRTEFLW